MKNALIHPTTAKFFLASNLLLACFATIAQQPLSGSFEYAFTADQGMPLWNFAGVYQLPSYYQNFEFHDASQLLQSANAHLAVMYDQNPGVVALAGTLTSGSKLKLRLNPAGTESKYYAGVKIKDKYSVIFDPTNRIFSGTDRVTETSQQLVMDCPDSFWECDKWRIANVSSTSIQPVRIAVPETADGNWNLKLDILAQTNKLSGTASIAFSNGTAYELNLLGRYSPKTQKAKLVLKGAGSDRGATLSLTISATDMSIESMHGVVSGQRVRFPLK